MNWFHYNASCGNKERPPYPPPAEPFPPAPCSPIPKRPCPPPSIPTGGCRH